MATPSRQIALQRYGTHLWVPEVQADWSRGMIRDVAPLATPDGALIYAADFLLHRPGVMQKRGGYIYAGPAMTAATYATGVIYAPFAAGAQLLAIGDNGHLYTVTSGSTTDVATLGSTFASKHRPVIMPSAASILAVLLSNDGTTAPKKWDGAAAANLGGSPPAALIGAVYKQRLVLANTSANPNRLWFSETPNIESTWDTSNKFLDTEGAVTGLAALNNVLLVFHQGFTERIIGAVPPGTVGTDMDKARMWDIGCQDSRAIFVQDGNVIFANSRGVYMSNGSTPISLTSQGGIDSYWQDLFYLYNPATWTISVGTFRQFVMVTVLDNNGALAGTNPATLMCYLPTRSWWAMTNIKATMYGTGKDTNDELYYADRSTNRVVRCVDLITPSTATALKQDADGTAILPTARLLFGRGPGVKDFGHGRVDYDLEYGSGTPGLAVSLSAEIVPLYGSSPDSQGSPYTPAQSPLTSPGDLHPSRKRFTVGRSGQALSVWLTQNAASNRTEIYAVEIEQRPQPTTAEGTS